MLPDDPVASMVPRTTVHDDRSKVRRRDGPPSVAVSPVTFPPPPLPPPLHDDGRPGQAFASAVAVAGP